MSDLFSSWNIEEIDFISFFHTFTDIVIVYSNVFRTLFLGRIGSEKDHSLVITVKRNFWNRKVIAIYSASVDDNATVFCRLVNHETGELARNKTYPVIDFRSSGLTAQSLSVYPKKLSWFAPLYCKATFLVDPRYRTM